MNKVITINLNGRAYQLEEEAYVSLRSYLDIAVSKLAENPDKKEIIADLEQAIAEKCDKYLNRHKNVVKATEVDQVIKEMGPVEDASEPAEGAKAAGSADGSADGSATGDAKKDQPKSDGTATPKRLYRIHEGSFIAGVCTGLAKYFNVDVAIVRVIFVILGFITHGGAILLYFLMVIFIPNANTGEERAAAEGRPFNAQELINRAKAGYKDFYTYSQREWRKHQREQRKQARHHGHAWQDWNWNWAGWNQDADAKAKAKAAEYPKHPQTPPATPHYPWVYYSGQFLGIVTAILTLLWIVAIIELVSTGIVYGFIVPASIPLWISLLVLIVVYNVVIYPLKRIEWLADRSVGHQDYYDDGWFGFMQGVMWFGLFALCFWLLYKYVPVTHPTFDKVITAWHNSIQTIQNAVRK